MRLEKGDINEELNCARFCSHNKFMHRQYNTMFLSIKSSQFFSYQPGFIPLFHLHKKNMFILDICELVGVLKKSLLLFSSQSMFGLQWSIALYPTDWPAELETTYVGDSNIGYKKFCYCNRIKLNFIWTVQQLIPRDTQNPVLHQQSVQILGITH